MKPRWNIDVLRGLLLAYCLHLAWVGTAPFRAGILPVLPQLWIGLILLIGGYVFCSGALLFPTRLRLQAVFVLLIVAVVMPLVMILWWARNHPGIAVHSPAASYISHALNIAAAVGAWWLYRTEPKTVA